MVLITAATLFNLYFTTAFHRLFSKQNTILALVPFFQCIKDLFAERQQLLLFLSFGGFLALCCILFGVQNNRPYSSRVIISATQKQLPWTR